MASASRARCSLSDSSFEAVMSRPAHLRSGSVRGRGARAGGRWDRETSCYPGTRQPNHMQADSAGSSPHIKRVLGVAVWCSPRVMRATTLLDSSSRAASSSSISWLANPRPARSATLTCDGGSVCVDNVGRLL